MVPHKLHFVVTFNEPLARCEYGLLTFHVIFSDGTRGDRNQSDTGMMVPASRPSRFEDNLCNCNVCRTSLAFHLDAVALSFERPERCSRYWGVVAPEGGVASAAPTTRARTATPSATSNIALLIVIYPFSFPYP
jgi:hypothetical protein